MEWTNQHGSCVVSVLGMTLSGFAIFSSLFGPRPPVSLSDDSGPRLATLLIAEKAVEQKVGSSFFPRSFSFLSLPYLMLFRFCSLKSGATSRRKTPHVLLGADDAAVMPLKLPLKRWACDEKINWHAPCGFSSIFGG